MTSYGVKIKRPVVMDPHEYHLRVCITSANISRVYRNCRECDVILTVSRLYKGPDRVITMGIGPINTLMTASADSFQLGY